MRFVHLGFAPDLVDYEQGWQTQREVHAQVVHAQSSYEASELVWNARFASLYNPPDGSGGISIDVGRLSEIEPL